MPTGRFKAFLAKLFKTGSHPVKKSPTINPLFDPSHPLNIPENEGFYGRDEQLSAIITHLMQQPSRVVLIGPTGMGKSSLLSKLAQNADSKSEIAIYHKIEAPVFEVDDLLSATMRQILERCDFPNFDLKSFRKALNENASAKTVAILSSWVVDLVDTASPATKNTCKELKSILGESFAKSQFKPQIEAIAHAPLEKVRGYTNLLQALAHCGLKASFYFDSVENASDTVCTAIVGISKTMPKHWNLVMTLNDELEEGLKILQGTFRSPNRRGELSYEQILGLTDKAIEQWLREARQAVPPEWEMLHAAKERFQGRPLYILPWIMTGRDKALTSFEVPKDSYLARLSALENPAAERLAILLSLFPANSVFPFDLVNRLATNGNSAETSSILNLLIANFFLRKISPSKDEYSFFHAAIGQSLKEHIPGQLRNEYARELLEAYKESNLVPETPPFIFNRAVLACEASDYSSFSEEDLSTARKLEENGAFPQAIAFYRAIRNRGVESNQADLAAKAILGIAETHLESGFYLKGLEELSNLSPENLDLPLRARFFHWKGFLHLRLNEYGPSRECIELAKEIFESLSDVDALLRSRRLENTILRDLEQYDAAQKHAHELLAEVEQRKGDHSISLLTEASCLRVFARSYAYSPDHLSKTLEVANRAKSLASDALSSRALAGAELAIGESFRHAGLVEDSRSHYISSRELASSVGDRDCYLWASLGLSDAWLMSSEFHKAEEALADVGDIVQFAPEAYPLEYSHWKFSDNILKVKQGVIAESDAKQLPPLYIALGLRWPEEYLDQALAIVDAPSSPKRF